MTALAPDAGVDVKPYYRDDLVTIYNTDALNLLPQLRSGSIHAVLTDPPYVIGAVSAGNMNSKSGGWADMMNSSIWFASWYCEVGRVLKASGVFWTFLNWRSLPVVMRAAMDARLPITSMAVWDKEWFGPGGPQGLRPSYEMVALLCGADYAIPDRGVADVIRHKVGGHKPSGHPAEKPLGLLSKLIAISALPNEAVLLDPFLGSGTTARAAKDAGIRCIGIEAEERYCEIAAARMAQEVFEL